MRRRQFLVGVSAALVVGPAWLKRAFGDASLGLRRGAVPLLAIVIPSADGDKSERGNAFGEYLMNGSDAQLAPLSTVELVCATVGDLQKVTREPLPLKPAEPLLVLIEPDGATRLASAAGLPSNVVGGRYVGEDQEEARIDARIRFLADRVKGVIGARPLKSTVAAAAAEVRARLKLQAPPGAHWARPSMCGYAEVEGLIDREADERLSMDCGMGHVPQRSARFLYFYSKTPQRRALERDGEKI